MRSGDGRGSGTIVRAGPSAIRFDKVRRACVALALFSVASGCASSERTERVDRSLGVSPSPRVISDWETRSSRPLAKGGGVYKVGKPYQIAGRWYHPKEEPNYQEAGMASWYGRDFHGRKTANGEIFDMHALTAAHRTLPMPSYAYVTARKTNRTILVRINDRGPFARDRILDLSMASAEALGLKQAGVGEVYVRYAGPAPLHGDDRHERRFLASQGFGAKYAQSYPEGERRGLGARLPRKAPQSTAGARDQDRHWDLTSYRQASPIR